jgi:hypothetical protein
VLVEYAGTDALKHRIIMYVILQEASLIVMPHDRPVAVLRNKEALL